MSLDQETILNLRDELAYAVDQTELANKKLQKVTAEFWEAKDAVQHWNDIVDALNLLIAVEKPDPQGDDKFRTFGGEVA